MGSRPERLTEAEQNLKGQFLLSRLERTDSVAARLQLRLLTNMGGIVPRSVYSIRAQTALDGHLQDIEKLLSLNTLTGKMEEAIREHISVARAQVMAAYEHAVAAGHLNTEFQRQHNKRLESLSKMEDRVNEFLRRNPPS